MTSKAENYLDFLTIVKYAIDNIHKISDLNEITSRFKTVIKNITEERKNSLEVYGLKGLDKVFAGQENHYFRFQESPSSFGEFSLDFLPPVETSSEDRKFNDLLFKGPGSRAQRRRLANVRVQLFSDRWLLPSWHLGATYGNVRDYLVSQFGLANTSTLALEVLRQISATSGGYVDCWAFKIEEINYAVTLYWAKKKSGMRGFVSFSVSEIQNRF